MKLTVKQSLIPAVLCVLSAPAAFATPACSSNVTGNGSLYFGGGYSCEIGDLLFSNFTYTASGTSPIPASEVTVETLGPASTNATLANANIGLQFSAPFTADTDTTTDATIDYTVTLLGGGQDLLEDVDQAQTSGVSGDGSASVVANACGPAPCLATGGSIYVLTFEDSGAYSGSGSTTFSPLSSLSLEDDLSVNGNTGFATISHFQDTFSQVATTPEPATLPLLGTGLTLLSICRRRRSSPKP